MTAAICKYVETQTNDPLPFHAFTKYTVVSEIENNKVIMWTH